LTQHFGGNPDFKQHKKERECDELRDVDVGSVNVAVVLSMDDICDGEGN